MTKRPLQYVLTVFCIMTIALFTQVFTASAISTTISATIDVHEDTVNLTRHGRWHDGWMNKWMNKWHGKWMTVYIEIPGSDVRQIDISTVILSINDNNLPAKAKPTRIGDYDNDGIPDLMVKFDRQELQSHLFLGPAELTVSGKVAGEDFEGTDTINVIIRPRGLKKVAMFQTSDIHNHASGYSSYVDFSLDGLNNDAVIGGYSRLAGVIADAKATQAAAGVTSQLLVDSGDWYMGTLYDNTGIWNAPGGTPAFNVTLNFFQQMGYDATTLGNHEFDWTPNGLAMILHGAMLNGFTVPVLCTNTVFDGVTPSGDDYLQSLLTPTGVLMPKIIKTLPNGLKVGFLGLLGPDADLDAPVAPPVTFNHDFPFIQTCVDDLRNNDNVDLVVVLSHGGIELSGSGDDTDLAKNVTGIDIICSGHYHTNTTNAFIKGASNTIIFEPGCYSEHLSQLVFSFSPALDRVVGFNYTSLDVDDSHPAAPIGATATAIQGMVGAYNTGLDAMLNAAPPAGFGFGTGMATPISRITGFDLEKAPLQVTGIGSLCADGNRAIANAVAAYNYGTPVQIGIVGTGVIRDGLYEGNTGIISFADVYNCLPLGASPYQAFPMGYPLMSIYATGAEIYTMCEVGITYSGLLGASYYLNFSGIKIDYNPALPPANPGVRQVSLYDPADTFCMGAAGGFSDPVAIDPFDTATLYHVTVDLYALQLLNYVNTIPGVSIIPKDAAGVAIGNNFGPHRIIADASGQELKEWMALWKLLDGAFPETGAGIPAGIYGPGGIATAASTNRVEFVNW